MALSKDNGDGDRHSDGDGGADGAKGEPRGRAATAAAIASEFSEETAPVKVIYSFSVEHELITSSFGVLSDLVLVGYDELYVTQVEWTEVTVKNTVSHYTRVPGGGVRLGGDLHVVPPRI